MIDVVRTCDNNCGRGLAWAGVWRLSGRGRWAFWINVTWISQRMRFIQEDAQALRVSKGKTKEWMHYPSYKTE